jgi:hypothetical protein
LIEETERKETDRIKLTAGRGEEGIVFGGILPIYVTEFLKHKNVGTQGIQRYNNPNLKVQDYRHSAQARIQ